jgi:hypothetical protein
MITNSILSASVRSAFSSMNPGAVRIAPGPSDDPDAMRANLSDLMDAVLGHAIG